MNDLVSIIIPVFNVEAYLDKCINSIVNQTYKKIEIILVDDGSSDNCPQICDEWTKRDKRIKVLHKSNGGLSSARNAGLKAVKGTFISFVDPDDYLEYNMLELLLQSITNNCADVSICNYVCETETGTIVETTSFSDVTICGENVMNSFLTFRDFPSRPVWNKLYRSQIIFDNSLVFDERIMMGEDFPFNFHYFSCCKSVTVLREALYHYLVKRKGQITYNINYEIVNRWRITKELLINKLPDSSSYHLLQLEYARELNSVVKEILSLNDNEFIEVYNDVCDEIVSLYNLVKKSDQLSKMLLLNFTLIKISRNMFRSVYRIYSKINKK